MNVTKEKKGNQTVNEDDDIGSSGCIFQSLQLVSVILNVCLSLKKCLGLFQLCAPSYRASESISYYYFSDSERLTQQISCVEMEFSLLLILFRKASNILKTS